MRAVRPLMLVVLAGSLAGLVGPGASGGTGEVQPVVTSPPPAAAPATAKTESAPRKWADSREPSAGEVSNLRMVNDPVKVKLKFAGGSLTQFVEALRQAAAPSPCNMVVNGDGPEPMLPPFEFEDVSVSTAAAAATRSGKSIGMSVVREEAGSAIYVFRYGPPDQYAPVIQTETDVLSLRGLLDAQPQDPEDVEVTMSPETVLSAVESAASVGDEESAPHAVIKYHQESSLLFIRGTGRQLKTVRSAIELLKDDVKRKRVMFDNSQVRHLESELAKMTIEVNYLRDQLAVGEDDVKRARQATEAGVLGTGELQNALIAQTERKMRYEKAMIEMNQMEAELKVVRSGRTPKVDPTAPGSAPSSSPGTPAK